MAFKSKVDPSGALNFTHPDPCLWPGIACSPAAPRRVVRLVLEDLNLTGPLPPGTLSSLDQLRVLSLHSNSLSGPIPSDLSSLRNLKSLFLNRNLFSGPFPAALLSLRRLRTLDLSRNNLSGTLPSNLSVALARLYLLRLDNNRFSGPVPPLNQSTLRIFNVSNNNFSGPVPVTEALSSFGASAFSGNPGLCGEVVRRECRSHFQFFRGGGGGGGGAGTVGAPSPAAPRRSGEMGVVNVGGVTPSRSNRFHRRAIMAVGLLALALCVVGMAGFLLITRRNRKTRHGNVMLSPVKDHGSGGGGGGNGQSAAIEEVETSNKELVAAAAMSEEKVKRMGKSGSLVFCAGEAQVYSLEHLMRASAEMLGRGSVGSTYKAVLDNRLIVGVKRVDAARLCAAGREAFERHMDAVGRLRHPNLVPLRAYFQAKEERLLVYDYQPNGSLFSLIHGSRSTRAKPLHWTSCLKIAEDVAQGLAYIHQASGLVHGNIKSSNVLLGPDFEACLTDNCLLVLVEPLDGDDDSEYRAPETRKSNRRLTPRSDVYAFGVLLLELLTGKPPLQHANLIATDLPSWVRSVREDDGPDDERLMMIVGIAAACIRSSPESRPTTWQVLKMIQEVKEADMGGDNDNDSSLS